VLDYALWIIKYPKPAHKPDTVLSSSIQLILLALQPPFVNFANRWSKFFMQGWPPGQRTKNTMAVPGDL